MQDGHYRIVFTTNSGTLGEGAAFVEGGQYVGADFYHSYRGTLESEAGALKLRMHCARQPNGPAFLIDLPEEFDMEGTVQESDGSFIITTRLPDGTALTATWTRTFPL